MTNLSKLDPRDKDGNVLCVVETTKGSRTKLDYDVDQALFAVNKVLPEGMSFPFDFGFIPSTLGEDGDPLDVVIVMDEPTPTGTVVPSRLVGVIEAEQTDCDGKTMENDRIVAISSAALLYRDVTKMSDLPTAVVEQIERFFVSYNDAEGKTFTPKGRHGPKRAKACLDVGRRRARKHH